MVLVFGVASHLLAQANNAYFEIQFIDSETGRGIPLVELKTVHNVHYVSDNSGRVAYTEPGHHGEQVFFSLQAHGYEIPKDGFGIAGIRVAVEPGESVRIPLKRMNLAERLYRITGEGLYRDSVLLGKQTPIENPLGTAHVVGQDSVQAAIYREKIHWFWGDTNRLSYPLGLFRTAGATSPLPSKAKLPIEKGLNLTYFTDNEFVRAMIDLPEEEGVVWIDGVCTVRGEAGEEDLLAHYSRRQGIAKQLAHGIAKYDDRADVFRSVRELSEDRTWQHLSNHPIEVEEDGTLYLQFGVPFPLTRVPATLEAVLDPEAYESWTCVDSGDQQLRPRRRDDGTLNYRWTNAPPVTPKLESRWLQEHLIEPRETIISPADTQGRSRRIQIHTGTVRWNPFRQKYIMIASENAFADENSPSHLGEVWYSEADSPQGPFTHAVKILTHDRQSFYNACHHPFFDEQNGRLIYFEGTYTNMFIDAEATPRYNYNQIMYRLDLQQTELKEAFSSSQRSD